MLPVASPDFASLGMAPAAKAINSGTGSAKK
jgi:hypothetical protein